jgi:hypothetical protein
MAASIPRNSHSQPSQGSSATVTINGTVNGNVLIASGYIWDYQGQNHNLSAAGGSLTWTERAEVVNPGFAGAGIRAFVATATTTGGNITCTISGADSDTYWGISMIEVAGIETTFGAASSQQGDNGTPSTGVISAGGQTRFFASGFTHADSQTTITPNGTWTQIHEDETADSMPYNVAWKVASSDQTHTWSAPTSVDYGAWGVAFEETGVGGSILPAMMQNN